MPFSEKSLEQDVIRLRNVPFLPALLEVVCTATGMGFAAVARVSEERWIAGNVKDEIGFGLKAGDELPIGTTICQEIRRTHVPVVIDHVAYHAVYNNHPVPALYGFESYISFPIVLKKGVVFGTLCAIDPKPAHVDTPAMTRLFTTLVTLIAQYIDGYEALSFSNRSRLDFYADAELRNALRELKTDAVLSAAGTAERVDQLSRKVDQLIMALDPDGAFLR